MFLPPRHRVPAGGGGRPAHGSVHHSLQSDGAGGEGSRRSDPSAAHFAHGVTPLIGHRRLTWKEEEDNQALADARE